ncbi:D-alanine-D-alanyl carrier protein ligase [Lactobacillus plantarum JDM1] [Lactiplantibacillus mudanjiangensis]|uniref:D-alanine--poly(phosphoribitol) ligase subunit DltA n=1 Tax=Lactiplantibacillus mudanjiangensis TaxID=1296538 RepID=UPI0010151037|nr:D-alanine--poly(phosphoribitol) ligase subunit DltA [Lactiplantibacillus mudanjiangensis]VDG30696.1 D-alanine-D-alanyl carrier protein ligase [Lactobacillus plantarum JDM1] [Lactiplantibacillus mudanjiangensis]
MIENMIKTIDDFARTQPTKVVYDVQGATHTYAELKAYSDALAAHLDSLDLKPKAPIIVFGGQTFEMIATFLGVVKAGRAYIPIDTHSPNERLTMINEIAEPAAVIAVVDLPTTVADTPVITPTELAQTFAKPVDYTADHAVSGDDDYYIIFTSGTTGKPKGVEISHDNLLSYVNWMLSDGFGLPKQPNSLSQPPYSFDLSVMDVYPTLALGGTLYALPKTVTDDFKQLFAALPQLPINVWVSTPSFMDICLLEPKFDAEHLPNLTHFLFCGEELTHKTAATLKQRFPAARIFNTYGPTETCVAVTQIEVTDEALAKYDRLPIGYAKADTKMSIVDVNGESVPAGTEGEIIISGPSVSKGYLNNPAKTEKAFFMLDGERAYHSGDIGVMDEDGLFRYRGRVDFQIKMHGYRIELEEVDHFLGQQQHIEQAVAVPKYNKEHKVTQMIAYVVPKENDFESDFALTTAIKKDLQGMMMEYMIPQRFVYKTSLPLTPNGKIDVKSIIKEVNPE